MGWVDVDGEFPILPIAIGALSGGGLSLLLRLALQGCVDWSQVWVDAAIGGIGGGIGGALAKARLLWAGRGAATIGRLPIPRTPGGMTLRRFGQSMSWGRGHAAARSHIPTLTREGLQRSGVTREIAEEWARFYRNEALRNPANPSALERAELMEAAARLLQ
jgi:hypothetical protein